MSVGFNLKACNLPESALAFTNRVYVSPADFSNLIGVLDDGSSVNGFVDVKGCVFTLKAHQGVANGGVALNKAQREYARIGLNAELFVKRFTPPANFQLGSMKLEVDFYLPQQQTAKREIKHEDIEKSFTDKFQGQPFAVGQPLALDHDSDILKVTVVSLQGTDAGDGSTPGSMQNGLLASHTEIDFQQGPSGKLHVLSNKVQQRSIFRPDFNFEELGIGGLDKEFGNIFRRAFAARVFPPQVIRDLGIKHVRGMLLHGPPGTGKTLIARQLANFLKSAEPKIVNGPEILNKYVGQAEENIRNLFADAEKEQAQQGEQSQLHVVIFDEIDSICKSRGSKSDSTGVHDSIVNQLLSKIDGVNALNNILLIGMTNRKDLIDDALLRPGRLEVHVEISLPDEHGRQQILNIHTKDMKKAGYLDASVSIPALAAQTKNFSGAELEGLIRSATSFALNRKVNITDLAKSGKDMGQITVTMDDLENALSEVKPMFGCHDDEFEQCISRHGIMHFSSDFEQVLRQCESLVEQVRSSENTPLLSMLLYGSPGAGKTAFSAFLASKSDYPFVRRIGSETFVGYSETAKVAAITKIFEDAYKSPLSVIVLDDLERLMDYVPIGPRFSTFVMSALFALLKKRPPVASRRLLIIGTTCAKEFLQETDMYRVFNVALHVPLLTASAEFKFVLEKLPGFTQQVVEEISDHMAASKRAIGIRTLLLVSEMALQRQNPIGSKVFMECMHIAGDA